MTVKMKIHYCCQSEISIAFYKPVNITFLAFLDADASYNNVALLISRNTNIDWSCLKVQTMKVTYMVCHGVNKLYIQQTLLGSIKSCKLYIIPGELSLYKSNDCIPEMGFVLCLCRPSAVKLHWPLIHICFSRQRRIIKASVTAQRLNRLTLFTHELG